MKKFIILFFIDSLFLLCLTSDGLIKSQEDKRDIYLINVKYLQQTLDLLEYKVKEAGDTYRNLSREKVKLTESCKLLQYQIDEMTSTSNCINTCDSTTTISSETSSTTASSSRTTTTSNISFCPKPCVNGECKPNGTAYSCFCNPGFGGDSCTDTICYQGVEPDHTDIVVISSPGYSLGSYPALQNCIWNNISLPGSSNLWISFSSDFSIEQSAFCPSPSYCCDYVSIYDGPTPSDGNLIGQYCGTSPPPPIYSSTGSISMVFYSDQSFLSKDTLYQPSTTWAGFIAYIGGVNDQQYCSDCAGDNQFCFQENGTFSCQTVCSGEMDPCLNGGRCTVDNYNFSCSCFETNIGPRCQFINPSSLVDCEDVYNSGIYKTSSVQTIYPDGVHPVEVYCEVDSTPYIWTYLQRRVDGSENFNRSWSDYETGFGSGYGSYWVGLKYQEILTNGRYNYRLRVDLMDCQGNTAFSQYNLFSILPNNYTLSATALNISSNAGDSISPFDSNPFFNLNGQPFSTYDRFYSQGENCPLKYASGWWWVQCAAFLSNLNGPWYSDCSPPIENGGIQWDTWKDTSYSYYGVGMKIRRSGD